MTKDKFCLDVVINSIPATEEQGLEYDDTAQEWFPLVSGDSKVVAGYRAATPPIVYGQVKSIPSVTIPAREYPQMVLITAGETPVTGTKYTIHVAPWMETDLGWQKKQTFSVTATAATTTDAILYAALKAKIDAYTGARVQARMLQTVNYTVGNDTGRDDDNTDVFVGQKFTQATSGAVVVVAAAETLTGGTWAGGNAAGAMSLILISGTWNATSKVCTAENGTVFTTAGALTENDDELVLRDVGSYHGATPATKYGQSGIYLNGFTTVSPSVIAEAILAQGIGTLLLAEKAVLTRDGQDVVTGDLMTNPLTDFVAGNFYVRVDVPVTVGANKDALSDMTTGKIKILTVWVLTSGTDDFKAVIHTAALAYITELKACAAASAGGTK